MSRGWLGSVVVVIVALALFAGVVMYASREGAKPRGFSGLEFASLTQAAEARTPLLPRGGALILDVMVDSPAARAGIMPGTVVAAIDGKSIVSARQASDMLREHAGGDHVTLTLYDIARGEVRPSKVALTIDAAPPISKTLSVRPPRTLAREFFYPTMPAANAAWSRRILRGPTVRPQPLTGLGAGQCNGFAPSQWHVARHASDNSMFHVMADEGFAHAIYQSASLGGTNAEDFVKSYLQKTFGAPVVLTPAQPRPFGFVLRDFGNQKGGAGFVVYRVAENRIALWLAAVPGGDVAWARPLAGAVALSLHCAAPGAPVSQPRDPALLATRISLRCIHGACQETDFAATYLTTLRFGYVHNAGNQMFLVRPHRDYWQNGAEGPGFYHQIGGENEKLEPGRIN